MRSLGYISAVLLLGACSSGAPYAQYVQGLPELKHNEARLVIYQECSMNMLSAALTVDHAPVGSVSEGGFIVSSVSPGKHVLSTSSYESDASITFTAKPGSESYAKLTYQMGVTMSMSRPQLVEIDPMQARDELAASCYKKET